MTEWPATRARQPKSTSSRKSSRFLSKPPSSSYTSRRISAPAVLTARTSCTPSRCPWSYSACSNPVQRAPLVAKLIPTSRRCVLSCQPSNFGPAIATLGRSETAVSKFSSASFANAQSSCRTQIHSLSGSVVGGNCPTAKEIASPKPISRSREIVGMRAPLSNFADASREPVSTAMMRSALRVCVAREVTTSGNHVVPSWTTRIAVTRCVLIKETYRVRYGYKW